MKAGLKNALLIATLLSLAWWTFWITLGRASLSPGISELERQTYALMGNLKLLIAIAFYVAWRVTP